MPVRYILNSQYEYVIFSRWLHARCVSVCAVLVLAEYLTAVKSVR